MFRATLLKCKVWNGFSWNFCKESIFLEGGVHILLRWSILFKKKKNYSLWDVSSRAWVCCPPHKLLQLVGCCCTSTVASCFFSQQCYNLEIDRWKL
jgi:hypothetical protein